MILIVEDEEKLASLLEDYLRQAGYDCDVLHRGDQVLDWLRFNAPEAILLDLMLPGEDGLSLCRQIRGRSDVPILITTARVEEIDRLLGLELGADDYICKPYSPREVVARVKAILRRTVSQKTATSRVQFDDARMQIQQGANSVALTAVEYQLLKHLASLPGRIFSRGQLMDRMYGDHRIVSDRTIDSHIKKIRRKLTELDPEHEFIHSVYGAGYRFEDKYDN